MGYGTYIAVSGGADVNRIFARAVEAGATVIWEPGTTAFRTIRCKSDSRDSLCQSFTINHFGRGGLLRSVHLYV
jgi:hypothetical protein